MINRRLIRLAEIILQTKEDNSRQIMVLAASKQHAITVAWKDIKDIAEMALIEAPGYLKKENARLRERLEMTHVYQYVNGKMVKRKVARGHFLTGPAIYDGIDCRDETIRQQDRYIKELKSFLARKKKPKYDDIGYDPRDGSSGKPEKQRISKQPARKQPRKFNRSDFYPSAKPPKHSP